MNGCSTINVADDMINVIYISDEYLRLRVEHHDFNECCEACRHNIRQFFVNQLSDIIIDENEQFYRNETCSTGFAVMRLQIIAASDEKQSDKNEGKFRIWMRRQQQEESKTSAGYASGRGRIEHGIPSKPFCRKIFPKCVRKKTGLDEK